MLHFAARTALFFALLPLVGRLSFAAEQILLSPKLAPHDLSRVSVDLEVGGHNLVRASSKSPDEETDQKLPMSVSARLEYDELRLGQSTASTQDNSLLAVRYYEKAEAVLKVDESGRSPRLAEDRRLIAIANENGRSVLYSPDGPLSREQLDLLDVIANSSFAEKLLPTNAVADGDTWDHSPDLMGAFLALDSVAVCEIQSVLDEHNANFAKVRMAGIVHGMSDGAATEMDVRALYLFDRRVGRIVRLNLAVREKRSIGGATPGVDAVAKLQLKIDPLTASKRLTPETIARATSTKRAAVDDVLYEVPTLGFRIRHDRQWFVAGEQRESVVLRRIDRGDLVAQCTLTALPPKSAGRQISLDQFQKDVRYSLGKNFGELVSSRQWQNAAGHYCFELIARGVVEDVPVEWHYYLVAPESGHRVSAAVTIEKPMVDRVAGADRELIESLELFPQMPAATTAAKPPARNKTTK